MFLSMALLTFLLVTVAAFGFYVAFRHGKRKNLLK